MINGIATVSTTFQNGETRLAACAAMADSGTKMPCSLTE
jgi:hypothetical protein